MCRASFRSTPRSRNTLPNTAVPTPTSWPRTRACKPCAPRIVYIDLWTLLADKNGKLRADLTNDGLHLMGEGYIVWRDAVLPYVK